MGRASRQTRGGMDSFLSTSLVVAEVVLRDEVILMLSGAWQSCLTFSEAGNIGVRVTTLGSLF